MEDETLARARHHLAINQPRRAVDVLQSAAGELSAQRYEAMALAFSDLGEYEEAARVARRGLTLDPANRELSVVLGVALSQLGEHAQALQLLYRAVAAQPENLWFGAVYAEGLINAGSLAAASRAIVQLSSLAPNALMTRRILARYHFVTGDLEAAQRVARGLLADHPDDDFAPLILGDIDAARYRHQESARWFSRAAPHHLDNPRVMAVVREEVALTRWFIRPYTGLTRGQGAWWGCLALMAFLVAQGLIRAGHEGWALGLLGVMTAAGCYLLWAHLFVRAAARSRSGPRT
ncbi:tetratricopeptide repeat protein [Aeromicrobium sp. YIM 150415]|uniref:tetratricopeptide repeat protein n=1 Tax=Aeromicrobium sp. YIM 150415 TaxID=2803912 RepID=UPI0019669876|nr:tetratricopeptide repeat protein [Aeromicrobium sp. YIM 150415]MBM9461916.1 tetratricopeptide repeat protein [Aeromicrobium sp. YIM 150415]